MRLITLKETNKMDVGTALVIINLTTLIVIVIAVIRHW